MQGAGEENDVVQDQDAQEDHRRIHEVRVEGSRAAMVQQIRQGGRVHVPRVLGIHDALGFRIFPLH